MRVTKKVRKVKNEGQGEHYIFSSNKHKIDEKLANKRRSKVFLEIGEIEEKSEKREFPLADKLSFNGVKVKIPSMDKPPIGGLVGHAKFKISSNEEFLAEINENRKKEHGIYFVPHSTKKKKDGSAVLQKRQGEALNDAYFSIPPWYSEFFAQIIEQKPSFLEDIQGILLNAISEAASELEKKTGYETLSMAVHPDARNAIGFHIQFKTVKDGKLLGRSAEGKVGRSGLRLAGDVNIALSRFDAVEAVPGAWKAIVKSRDYDDVAMDTALIPSLNKLIFNLFEEQGMGQDMLDEIDFLALEHVKKWKKSTNIQGKIDKAEREDLAKRVSKIETHLKRVAEINMNFP